MSRHKNQNKKNAKNGITSTVNLALHKHMEKDYEGSNILLLESGALSKSLQIYIAFFTIYDGSTIW